MSDVQIIDRGRGPELADIRITVFDLLPYFQEGWNHASIALWFGISSAQVNALHDYFESHREEVLAAYGEILARVAKGNPPEFEARREQSRAKLQALRERLREQRQQGTNHEGNSG
jgi:uncharacterized protein (DUF433 family)